MALLALVGLLLLAAPARPVEAVRLFTGSFEPNDFNATEWSGNAGSPTIQTTTVHSGTYALQISSGAGREVFRQLSANVTSGTHSYGIYFQKAGNPAFSRSIFRASNTGLTDSVRVRITSTGAWTCQIAVAPGAEATGTVALSNNVWYRIEVQHLISDTVGTLTCRLYTGDSTSIDETLTPSQADTNAGGVQRLYLGDSSADFGANLFFDDIRWNDATGAFQTSWPGPGKIALLEPGSNVANAWELQSGTGCGASAGTFTNVDDLPGTPDDDTTDNCESVTLNSIDRFGVTALPAAVPADADMILLDVYGRVGSTATTGRSGRFKVWDETAALTNGPTISFAVNGYRIVSVGATAENQVFDLGARTKANVEAFNLGYENITDAAARVRKITALWANVEWIESAGGGPPTCPKTLALLGVGC